VAVVRYLVDKSAWARLRNPPVAAILGPLVEEGLVATCGVVDLEILYSARNAAEHAVTREERGSLPRLEISDAMWRRAEEVQAALAHRSTHRGVSIPDLLIAATAELHSVGVLHYDKDFDLIADVTGQECAWIVPRGSAS
jgi:predicted nucleic acid-binding protein